MSSGKKWDQVRDRMRAMKRGSECKNVCQTDRWAASRRHAGDGPWVQDRLVTQKSKIIRAKIAGRISILMVETMIC